ncbi:pre-rRNA-processing protein TSR2 [Lepidopterella palustris CBS 459.81]|uniref:Pre-rRNA-processing protein TSR2 n=1 Tax=Lepidopterella palustris CBS 459.81 TaxID=1314670 RepID=A0A8E2E0U2_9PEZI|nr:pre-rRNA-processing protein TSR2 [Lepidopterella palustris CBS 459.81]
MQAAPAALTSQPEISPRRLAAQALAKFDLGIWHTLFNWPILTVAIQNQWGGPDSEDKRDWLAGAISEIFQNQPETDALDLEIVLLQALEDEFGIRLEDETEVAVARDIMNLHQETSEGHFATVDALHARWMETKGKDVQTGSVHVEERNQDVDCDSVDEESDEDEDVDMSDAPALVAPKEKLAAEIDEEGFTKVVGKRRK